jgi:hypothetical protein
MNTKDILFVASSGNASGGGNNDLTPDYPASFTAPGIVSVTATDGRDALAAFSNWGPSSVDLGAPGERVFSTQPLGLFGYESGTSMSAPLVTGAAALVLSACPLSTTALKDTLLNTTDAIPSLAGRTVSGGRLNVFRAVMTCAGGAPASFGLAVSPGRVQLDPNQTTTLSVTVTGANGFGGPVNLAVQDLPAGISATLSSTSISGGSGSSTLMLSVAPTVEAGTYVIGVIGTNGGIQRLTAVSVTVGFTISTGQSISGQLSTGDSLSVSAAGKYADLYSLTLGAPTALNIDLKSRYFDTAMYVRSSSGHVLFYDDDSGPSGNSWIRETLPAGTYSIEVTSKIDGATGRYNLSINTPTLLSVVPYLGVPGSTVNVTLSGDRLAAPLTIAAGNGIVVSSLNVLGPSLATAVLTLEPSVARTVRDLTVQTSEGRSNALAFIIPPAINIGQRISAELSSDDQISTNNNPGTYIYSDIYQFTLSADTSVTIDLITTAFSPVLRVLSSNGSVLSQGTSAGSNGLSRITASLTTGTYFIEATSSSSLATGAYNLAVNMPFLNTLSPGFLAPGTSTVVQMSGSRFAIPMTIVAGSDITVIPPATVGATSASPRFDVAASAKTGRRPVTFTTSAGVSNEGFVNIVPISTITTGQTLPGTFSQSDPPSSGSAGAHADMYRFSPPVSSLALIPFTILTRSNASRTSLVIFNSAGAVLATAASDGTGTAGITGVVFSATTLYAEVSSDDQASYSVAFNGSIVTSLAPNFGVQSSTVSLILRGDFLRTSLATIDAGPGITVSNLGYISATEMSARLAKSSSAAVGRRDVRITTVDGTDALPFTVFPAIPIIENGQTISGTLSSTDAPSLRGTGTYADLYSLTLQGSASVELRSTAFNPSLSILDSQGAVSVHNEGTSVARLLNLVAGTYLIEVTSTSPGLGAYALSIVPPPTLTSITPNNGAFRTTFGVILRGTNFSPSLKVSGGGLLFRVSDVRVYSATLATAILSIGSQTGASPTVALSVNGDTGSSNTLPFTVTTSSPPTTDASVLRFPRFFSPGDLGGTGIAIVNPGSLAAEVLFSKYSDTGILTGYYLETIGARSQMSRLASELFPQAGGSAGSKLRAHLQDCRGSGLAEISLP